MPDKAASRLIPVEDDWIPEAEYARLIGRTRRTLRNWRRKGIGPPFSIAGKSALYRRSSWPEYLTSIEQRPEARPQHPAANCGAHRIRLNERRRPRGGAVLLRARSFATPGLINPQGVNGSTPLSSTNF
jgi:hypothetical protein